ncbi:MAG: Na/Pi cotransporter family protein [Anaeroplasma sp.]
MPTFNFDIPVNIMMVIGGLGLFLFGIELMGNSLRAIAGDRLRVFIEKSTNTAVKGVLVGALVTALIQSSSGTTALTVSLVRAGLLSFAQSVGIIMGANIGTTITPFMMSFSIEQYAMWFVGLGALIMFFFKKERVRQFGSILLGFGLLFLGLWAMGGSLKAILANPGVNAWVAEMFTILAKYPILGLLVGTLITACVQSSAATILILQTLYTTQTGDINGAAIYAVTLQGAIPILLGCNIGTTVTAILSAFGGGTQAKRTAFVHALFNVAGATIFMILTCAGPSGKGPFVLLMEWLQDILYGGANNAMIIALAHIIFNITTTFILFFFIKWMVKLTEKIVKDKEQKEEQIADDLLDYSLINKSSILALSFVKKAIDYMAKCVSKYVYIAKSYSFERDEKLALEGAELEKMINCLDKRIHDYLIKLTLAELDKQSSKLLSKYLDLIKDLERVGDHCTNIIEFFEERYDKDMKLSEDGTQDLEQMYSVLTNMVDGTVDSIEEWSSEKALDIAKYEDEIDKLEDVFHERHVHRVNSGLCSFLNTEHYVEILANIERMGDHLKNVLDGIIDDEYCSYNEYNH